MKPLVSVIVPTYNSLETLKQTLACLFQQSYPAERWEIIVVDDGSTDGTRGYLEQLAQQQIIRYHAQPNRGPAAARNAGARLAAGTILVFTDHDCLPAARWLEALIASYPPTASVDHMAIGGRVEPAPFNHWLYSFYLAQEKRHRNNHQARPLYLDTANMSLSRNAFLLVHGFDESFPFSFEDIDLGERLRAAGCELRTTAEALVHHYEPESLADFMRKSLSYGFGAGIYHVKKYRPEPPATAGRRGILIRHLMAGPDLAAQLPKIVRRPAYTLAVGLRCAAVCLLETRYFFGTFLPGQIARYRARQIPRLRLMLYLILEWCDFMPFQVGKMWGALNFAFRNCPSSTGGAKEKKPESPFLQAVD